MKKELRNSIQKLKQRKRGRKHKQKLKRKLSLWVERVVSQQSIRQKEKSLALKHPIGLKVVMEINLRDRRLRRSLNVQSRQSLWMASPQGQVRRANLESQQRRLISQRRQSHSLHYQLIRTNLMPQSSQVRGCRSRLQRKTVHHQKL